MGKAGVPSFDEQSLREVVDLYNWGMPVWMLCAFYDVHKSTLKEWLRPRVTMRPNGTPRHLDLDEIEKATSIRRRKHGAAGQDRDPFEDVFRSVREHARALQDKRTAQHREDASMHSCRAAAS